MDRLNDRLPRSLKSIFAAKTPADGTLSDHDQVQNTTQTSRRHARSASLDTAQSGSDTLIGSTTFKRISSHSHSIGGFIRSHYRSSSASKSSNNEPKNSGSSRPSSKPTRGFENHANTFSDGTGTQLESRKSNRGNNTKIIRSSTTPVAHFHNINTPSSPQITPVFLKIPEKKSENSESITLPASSSSPDFVSSPVSLQMNPADVVEDEVAVPNSVTCTSPIQKPLNSNGLLVEEPGEINDAALDSDDHEDDEDPDEEPSSPVINYSLDADSGNANDPQQSRPNIGDRRLSRTHSHMIHADAESIIGGINTRASIDQSQQMLDEVIANQTSERKTFSFSLPFSNPLASIEFRNFRPKLPSLFGTDSAHPGLSNEEFNRMQAEVENQLTRQLTVSSMQETDVYNSIKQQDNSRLRAIRQTLTPNITIDRFNPLSPAKPDSFPAVEGEVVIMGGYRGSILRDRASGRRVWIPIKAGFNLRKIDLTVGPRDEDEYEMFKKIYPDGMLSHIGPVDVSRKLIKKLRANPNCKVYEFGYDWRLSSDINSERLRKFLKDLPSNKHYNKTSGRRKGAIVIAHSMGGLIAHHAMQQEPTLFRGLLYAGVPSSCPNILGPLRHGDSVLMSSKILTQQVNFLMRSSYVFLPLDGRCFVNKYDSSIKYDLDFFDVNTWIKYELSPLVVKNSISATLQSAQTTTETISKNYAEVKVTINNITRDLRSRTFGLDPMKTAENFDTESKAFTLPDQKILEPEEAIGYLDRTLKRTKKFLLELEYDAAKANLYPPLATLYSYSVPTLKGSKVENADAIRTDSYEDLLFGAGDGVIYHKWTMPEPKGFSVVARVATDRGHVGLLNDVDAAGRALAAILEAEQKNLIMSTGPPEPIVHNVPLPLQAESSTSY